MGRGAPEAPAGSDAAPSGDAGSVADPVLPADAPDSDAAALAVRLQARCLAAGLTVGLAESCTGGLVAAAITDVPGCSGYFAGGIVSYANEAKRDLLGVEPQVLDAHGAVSAQVARSMALGARDRFGASLGASVTGIAGPDGGTPAKPVGLTYIGVADPGGVDVRRIVWTGDRAANRRDSARAVLRLLLERVEAGLRTDESAGATGAAAGGGAEPETETGADASASSA